MAQIQNRWFMVIDHDLPIKNGKKFHGYKQ